MIMNVSLSRSDNIYKEIEEFEDYELQNCIAYEMAIRNKKYKATLIRKVSAINDLFLSYRDNKPITDKSLIDLIEFYNANFDYNKESRDEFINNCLIDRISISLRDLGINEKATYELLKIDEIKDFEIIKYIKKTYEKEKPNILDDEINVYSNEGYKIIQSGPIEEDDTFIPENKIMPDFKRPFLRFRNGKCTELLVNLSLPLNELICYLKKVKNDYTDNPSILKTPYEIMELDIISINNSKKQKKQAIKYADHFFCYDYLKSAKENNPKLSRKEIFVSIDNELMNYHKKATKYCTYSNFIKYVLPNMVSRIEKEKYLELVSIKE